MLNHYFSIDGHCIVVLYHGWMFCTVVENPVPNVLILNLMS